MRFLLFAFTILNCRIVLAQLTPPGTGDNSKLNAWFALGLLQDLDSAEKWTSLSYLGIDAQSSLNSYNAFQRIGIVVLNEEVKYRFHTNWSTSLALSYRHQNEYEHKSPYEKKAQPFKQEFRVYGRISKSFPLRWKPSITFREEFRKFYSPDFEKSTISSAFRTRLKIQTEIPLNQSKQLTLLLGAENLFSIDYSEQTENWGRFSYTETRLSGFLSFKTKNEKAVYSLGFMDDLLESSYEVHNVPYISFSVLLRNIL